MSIALIDSSDADSLNVDSPTSTVIEHQEFPDVQFNCELEEVIADIIEEVVEEVVEVLVDHNFKNNRMQELKTAVIEHALNHSVSLFNVSEKVSMLAKFCEDVATDIKNEIKQELIDAIQSKNISPTRVFCFANIIKNNFD